MVFIKKSIPKLKYKKFLKLRQNVQNRPKLLKFKAKKWQNIILKSRRDLKNPLKLKNIDQLGYFVPKFTDFFAYKYRSDLYIKQKIIYFYGYLKKKYLKSIIKKLRKKTNLSYFLVKLLESRLDSVLYRSHFVSSFRDARQLISHGHVFVNGNKIITSSFVLSDGDVISLSKNVHRLIEKKVLNSSLVPITPKYLQVNYKIFHIIFLGNLKINQLVNQFSFWVSFKTLIEFYRYN